MITQDQANQNAKHSWISEMLPDHIKRAIEEYVPPLGDWLDTTRACEMAQLIIETKPKVVVEIGTFKGQSMLAQAFALRENNDGGKIYAIDPWKKEFAAEGDRDPKDIDWWSNEVDLDAVHQQCMQTIWDHRLDDWVVVIRAASQNCYELFDFKGIDILYIDGNHSTLASVRDVGNYAPRVRSDGYIWMDDTDWPSTQDAVRLMSQCSDLERDHGNYRLYRKL